MYDKELLEVKKKVDKLLAHKTPQYKQGYNKAIDDVIYLIVNTPTSIRIEHWRENDVLVDRQNEIIDLIKQLKG